LGPGFEKGGGRLNKSEGVVSGHFEGRPSHGKACRGVQEKKVAVLRRKREETSRIIEGEGLAEKPSAPVPAGTVPISSSHAMRNTHPRTAAYFLEKRGLQEKKRP